MGNCAAKSDTHASCNDKDGNAIMAGNLLTSSGYTGWGDNRVREVEYVADRINPGKQTLAYRMKDLTNAPEPEPGVAPADLGGKSSPCRKWVVKYGKSHAARLAHAASGLSTSPPPTRMQTTSHPPLARGSPPNRSGGSQAIAAMSQGTDRPSAMGGRARSPPMRETVGFNSHVDVQEYDAQPSLAVPEIWRTDAANPRFGTVAIGGGPNKRTKRTKRTKIKKRTKKKSKKKKRTYKHRYSKNKGR